MHLNDVAPGQLVRAFLLSKFVVAPLHLLVVLPGDVAHLFLDVPNEVVVTVLYRQICFLEFFCQLPSYLLTSNVDGLHGVRQGVALEDRDGVGHAFATLSDQTCGRSCGKEGEDSCVLERKCFEAEGIEHDLGQVLLIFLLAHRAVSHQHSRVAWLNIQFISEHVVQQLRQAIPVADLAPLNWEVEVVVTAADECIVANLFRDGFVRFRVAIAGRRVVWLEVFTLANHCRDDDAWQVFT